MTPTRLVYVALLCSFAAPAVAAPLAAPACTSASDYSVMTDQPGQRADRVWRVSFDAAPATALLAAGDAIVASNEETQPARPRPKAVEYSDAYRVRLKIHKIASFATIPLFVTEWALGQKLYNFTGSDSVRSAHKTIATSLGVLFGVNTVTGVWNLWEGRHDPNHRTKRIVHSILMLGADAGFAISGAMAPSRHDIANYQDRFAPHRAVAITSIAAATAGYLIMLFGR